MSADEWRMFALLACDLLGFYVGWIDGVAQGKASARQG